MAHDHSHAGHSHGAGAPRGRLAIAFGVALVVLVAEVVGSVLTGSLALLTDAGHMLVDVLGLGMALTAVTLMLRPTSDRRTWGLRRAEVLAAGAQAALLSVVGLYSLVEGTRRLFAPPEVPGPELLIFGVLGLAANIVGLLVLASGRNSGLNMRAAFLEVAADALGSIAVILAAVVIWTTGWERADPVAGLLIALIILPRAWRILRESVSILLESTPPEVDVQEIRDHILDRPHVREVHDLHVTRIDSNLPVLTAHVVLDEECFHDGHAPEILHDLQTCLGEHFPLAIDHSTFQFDRPAHVDHEDLHPERREG
ncbi:cation diffusion facilitator family transporter [Brevibacterium litoralis]|uniref:cation diffusion facilitator family transporter n=1 Tax=Brevibacterium litoralis TaxID=3138935 RepID=UPI0032ECC5C9